MEKVIVLTCTWAYDYETGMNVKVFSDIKKAQEEMRRCYDAELDDFKSEYEDEEMVDAYIGEGNASISESGDYTRNHIDWDIFEEEVQ